MIRYLADVLSFTQRIYSAQIFFCGHYQLPMISIYLSWWGHIWVMAQTGKRRGGGNRKHHCGRIGMLPPFFTALLLQASSFNSVQVICWSPCTGRERFGRAQLRAWLDPGMGQPASAVSPSREHQTSPRRPSAHLVHEIKVHRSSGDLWGGWSSPGFKFFFFEELKKNSQG